MRTVGYDSPSAVKVNAMGLLAPVLIFIIFILFYFMKQDRELSDLLLFISFRRSKY